MIFFIDDSVADLCPEGRCALSKSFCWHRLISIIDNLISSDLLMTDNLVNSWLSLMTDRNVRSYPKSRRFGIYWLFNNGQSYKFRSSQWRMICTESLEILTWIFLFALLMSSLSIYPCLAIDYNIELLVVIGSLL